MKTSALAHDVIIKKEDVSENDVDECNCSSHLVKLYSWFCDADRIYLVMELCPHGDLYQLKQRYGLLRENDAKFLVRQVLLGLKFLHSKGIVHRDLKLANLLIGADMRLKIADFGLAARLEEPERFEQTTFCGTPNYIAPEIVGGSCTHSHGLPVDLWSIGCLLHMLLTGEAPFQQKQMNSIKRKGEAYPYQNVDCSIWRAQKKKGLSANAIDILDKLLEHNPSARITVTEALDHSFFQSGKMTCRKESDFCEEDAPSAENVNYRQLQIRQRAGRSKRDNDDIELVTTTIPGNLSVNSPMQKISRIHNTSTPASFVNYGGYTKEEIQEIIKENTFQTASAKMQFATWRKINV